MSTRRLRSHTRDPESIWSRVARSNSAASVAKHFAGEDAASRASFVRYMITEAPEWLTNPSVIKNALTGVLCADLPPDDGGWQSILGKRADFGRCGRVLSPGEVGFSCRRCGSDPTCVVCPSCFEVTAASICPVGVNDCSGEPTCRPPRGSCVYSGRSHWGKL